jgi:hypothetical protein
VLLLLSLLLVVLRLGCRLLKLGLLLVLLQLLRRRGLSLRSVRLLATAHVPAVCGTLLLRSIPVPGRQLRLLLEVAVRLLLLR